MTRELRDFWRLWRIEDIGGGVVCFAGSRIRVAVVAGRFAGGDTIEELARDYSLEARDIEAGLRLVVCGAFSSQGLRAVVARAMEEAIPLLPARPAGVATPGEVVAVQTSVFLDGEMDYHERLHGRRGPGGVR